MYKGKRIFPKMVSTKILPHYQKLASQDKVLFKTAEPIVGYITQTFLKFSQVHISFIASYLHYILILLFVDSVSYKIKSQFDKFYFKYNLTLHK